MCTMNSKTASVVLLVILLRSAAWALPEPGGLSDTQFDHALRNHSTAPNYVLVTVHDVKTGSREPVCVEAQFLWAALGEEHGLKADQVVPFAILQPDRTFSFTKPAALSSLKPEYTPAVLQEAREFLGKLTVPQIAAATKDQKSRFYEFCARQPGGYAARFPALAHVLSEQGILCTRGCLPGMFIVEMNRLLLARQVAPLKQELVPVLSDRIRKGDPVEFELLCQALIGSQLTLRADAATALGDSQNPRAIPFLIDALSDESLHVGADYSDPGDNTTRHRSNKALKKLTGHDFGFVWNDPPAKRVSAIAKWTRWYLTEEKPKNPP